MSAAAQVKAIWDYLINIFETEKALGSAGRLATLQDVRHSIDFYTDASPVLGVQPLKTRYLRDYAQRRPIYAVDMIIALAAYSTDVTIGDTTTPANLDAAMYDTLQPLLDDGNGNGIEAVIRDPKNVLLGGLAVNSLVTDASWDWAINRGPNMKTWAYVVYTLTVETIVQI